MPHPSALLLASVAVCLTASGCTGVNSDQDTRPAPVVASSAPESVAPPTSASPSASPPPAHAPGCAAHDLFAHVGRGGAALGTFYLPVTVTTTHRCRLGDGALELRTSAGRLVERLSLADRPGHRWILDRGRGVVAGVTFRGACVGRAEGPGATGLVVLAHGQTVISDGRAHFPTAALACRTRIDGMRVTNRGPSVRTGAVLAVVRTVRSYLRDWQEQGPLASYLHLVRAQRAPSAVSVPRLREGRVRSWRLSHWHGPSRLTVMVTMEMSFRGNRGAWNDGSNTVFVTGHRQPGTATYLLSLATSP